MADYSREDSAYAERILGRLIEGEARGLELEPGLAVADLEQDARQFADEMALLDDFDAPCPSMRIDGETVPVSLLLAFRANLGWFPGFPPGFGKSRYWRMTPELYYGMRPKGAALTSTRLWAVRKREAHSQDVRLSSYLPVSLRSGPGGITKGNSPGRASRSSVSVLHCGQRRRRPQDVISRCPQIQAASESSGPARTTLVLTISTVRRPPLPACCNPEHISSALMVAPMETQFIGTRIWL